MNWLAEKTIVTGNELMKRRKKKEGKDSRVRSLFLLQFVTFGQVCWVTNPVRALVIWQEEASTDRSWFESSRGLTYQEADNPIHQ
jgi:hypothetical protein